MILTPRRLDDLLRDVERQHERDIRLDAATDLERGGREVDLLLLRQYDTFHLVDEFYLLRQLRDDTGGQIAELLERVSDVTDRQIRELIGRDDQPVAAHHPVQADHELERVHPVMRIGQDDTRPAVNAALKIADDDVRILEHDHMERILHSAALTLLFRVDRIPPKFRHVVDDGFRVRRNVQRRHVRIRWFRHESARAFLSEIILCKEPVREAVVFEFHHNVFFHNHMFLLINNANIVIIFEKKKIFSNYFRQADLDIIFDMFLILSLPSS